MTWNRIKTFLIFLTAILVMACNAQEKQNENSSLPNILYILADDMGYGDIEALNPDSKIPTPNLNRLASGGMVFTDAHSPSAVCTPTRYGILTGRYCFRSRLESGVLVGHAPSLIEPGRLTVASLLKQSGYRTGCIGKWHLGVDFRKKEPGKPLTEGDGWTETVTTKVDYTAAILGGPADHGFDYSFILPSSLDIQPYFYIRNRHIVNPEMISIPGSPDVRSQGAFWRGGDASEDFDFYQVLPDFTKEAINFISDHQRSDPDVPFFLYLALAAPHTPWVPVEEFSGRSEAGLYGDFVAQVDHSTGEIFRQLDNLGISRNTLVIFTSDNGAYWWPENIRESGHRSNFVFSGMKSDLWEGGHHIPFIARWPETIEAGVENTQLICLTDLMATCAEIVNVSLPYQAGEDSFSHLPSLLGEKEYEGARKHLVMQSFDGRYAIREGNWKLVLSKGSGGWSEAGDPDDPDIQLYDLEKDLREQQNLYLDNPEVVKNLTEKLEMFRKERRSRY